jgi:hypothetical protein
MPEVTPGDAVQRLLEDVRGMDHDDLRETHNELFPEKPISPVTSSSQAASIRQKVLDYLASEVTVEEILDLWSIIRPEARNVYFDDESGTIHYLVEPEALQPAD